MDMNAFFGITFSIILLRWWWKRNYSKPRQPRLAPSPKIQMVHPKTDAEIQRERDIEALRKQGYSDQIIATILPVINDGE